MKTLLFCLVLAGACGAGAQSSRFTTLVARSHMVTNDGGGLNWVLGSNSVEIAAGEAVKIVALNASPPSAGRVTIIKDGILFSVNGSSESTREMSDNIVEGPVVFRLEVANSPPALGALLTLERMPMAFPPDKTLVMPAGAAGVAVALECSTNLVNWTAATNGIYSTPDTAKFFRIRAEK